jgi:hypothetical protein
MKLFICETDHPKMTFDIYDITKEPSLYMPPATYNNEQDRTMYIRKAYEQWDKEKELRGLA